MPSYRKKKASAEADRYVARLFSAELTDCGEQEIVAWREKSPDNAAAFEESLAAYASVEGLADDADLLAASDEFSGGVEPRFVRPRRHILGLAAGILVIVTAGVLAVFTQVWDGDSSLLRLTTEVGARHKKILSDGSVLTLNTNTALIVDFSAIRRRIILDRGEVFFDVMPDPERPFTVEVGSKSITAVGTQFNVLNVAGRDLTVAVFEGVVALHRWEDRLSPNMEIPTLEATGKFPVLPDQYRLKAGTVLTFKETGSIIEVSQEIVESFSNWRHGFVRFDGTPLNEVVREISRYTDQNIVIDDPRIMNLKVSAVLNLEQLDAIFVGLERTLPVKLVRFEDQIVIQGNESAMESWY